MIRQLLRRDPGHHHPTRLDPLLSCLSPLIFGKLFKRGRRRFFQCEEVQNAIAPLLAGTMTRLTLLSMTRRRVFLAAGLRNTADGSRRNRMMRCKYGTASLLRWVHITTAVTQLRSILNGGPPRWISVHRPQHRIGNVQRNGLLSWHSLLRRRQSAIIRC